MVTLAHARTQLSNQGVAYNHLCMLHPQASKLPPLVLALPTHNKPTLHALEAAMSTDAAIDEDHYATAANFGGDVYLPEDGRPPFVKRVTVPESIKRRVPSKHYVSVLVHVYSRIHK